MASIGSINAGSKIIDLYAISGEVVDQQQSAYTQVTNNNNNQQQVSTTHYNKIFVRAEDGSEKSIEIVDSGFRARTGSRASIIWGIRPGKEEGPYLAVVNHDTGDVHTIRKPINDFASPPFYNMLLIVASLFIALGVVDLFSGNVGSAIAMSAIGGALIYWIYSRQKALLAKVKAAALALRPWG
jgi:hypothetical protein